MSIAYLDFRPIRQRILCRQVHFGASRRIVGMLICPFSYPAPFPVKSVELDADLHHGLLVHYDNGQTAEVFWAFIRELPPKPAKK